MCFFLRRLSLLVCLLCASIALPLTAQADISQSEASKKAKSAHGGKVLSVKLVRSENGITTYKVKLLLNDGRVKTVTVSG